MPLRKIQCEQNQRKAIGQQHTQSIESQILQRVRVHNANQIMATQRTQNEAELSPPAPFAPEAIPPASEPLHQRGSAGTAIRYSKKTFKP